MTEFELWRRAIAGLPGIRGDTVRFNVQIDADIDGFIIRAYTHAIEGMRIVTGRLVSLQESESTDHDGKIRVLAKMAGDVMEAYLVSQLPRTRAT